MSLLSYGVAATLFLATPASSQAVQSQACSSDVAPAATVERVVFQTRGRDIESLLYRPTTPANGAAIVVLHGSGGLQPNVTLYEARLGQLASRGYHIIMPGYYAVNRGSRPGQTRPNPLAHDHWKQVVDEAAEYLAGLPGVSADRIGVWGYSQGAGLAVESALDNGPAKAVVGVAGASGLNRINAPAPVLLIAADQDPVVPYPRINQAAESLRRQGITVTLETLHTADHIFDAPIWCEVFDKSRTFFDETLLKSST